MSKNRGTLCFSTLNNAPFKVHCMGKKTTYKKISLSNIQSRAKVYKRLLDKPYVNGVTLRGQNLSLKYFKPLELLTCFVMGVDLLMLKIWGP